MDEKEAKQLAKFGGDIPWGPREDNRPNEDRPMLVRPAEEKHRSCSRRMALECGIFRTLLPEVYGDYCCELTIDWDPEAK